MNRLREALDVKGRYFVVSLRNLPQGRLSASELRGRNEKLLEAARKFTADTAEKYALTPVILPMQTSHDLDLCTRLAEAVDGAKIYSPECASELIGFLAGAEFVIGMRLHAVIFASSAGVPVIGLSYDPKVDGMMNALGQPYSISLSDTDGIADGIAVAVEDVMKNRDAIIASLSEKAKLMREQCREDVRDVMKLI